MTSLPLTKNNLKNFMKAYSAKMEGKQQTPTQSLKSGKSSRGFSRSRSRGRGGKIKFKNKHTNQRASIAKGKLIKEQAFKTIKPIIELKNSSDKRLALCKSGYFDSKDSKVDIPSIQKENDQLVREIQLAVGAIKAGLKDHPIKMRLSAAFVLTTTVTTGVTNTLTISGTGNGLNPSYCTEWSTITALFDQCRGFGGSVKFNYFNPVGFDLTVNNHTSNGIPTMGYDSGDSTAATSVLSLTQLSEHKSFECLASQSFGGAGVTPNLAAPAACATHSFKWHVPRGIAISTTTGVSIPGTEWWNVASVGPLGFLKFYHIGSGITAKDTGAGIVYFDLEFRCRE